MNDRPNSTFARCVRAARPRARKCEIRDDNVIGLGLTIQPSGVRTLFFAHLVHGRRRFATTGSADVPTAPEARPAGSSPATSHRSGPTEASGRRGAP